MSLSAVQNVPSSIPQQQQQQQIRPTPQSSLAVLPSSVSQQQPPPPPLPPPKTMWQSTQSADGKTYYYNVATGESSWTLPSSS